MKGLNGHVLSAATSMNVDAPGTVSPAPSGPPETAVQSSTSSSQNSEDGDDDHRPAKRARRLLDAEQASVAPRALILSFRILPY